MKQWTSRRQCRASSKARRKPRRAFSGWKPSSGAWARGRGQIDGNLVRIEENLIALTDIVREVVEENREEHRRFQEFHQEVDGRFNILIKMMDEWICERRKGNGSA